MNSQSNKTNSSNNVNPRAIISGKLKRPSKQLISISSTNKKPFLKQYSIAMQQKLQSLKQKINEKKKQKTKQQTNIKQKRVDPKLENFLKNKQQKNVIQKKQKNIQQTILNEIEKQRYQQFLVLNNLLIYKSLLLENEIDTLQILAEASQKQLQQIGIPKGHALKLKVNINKYMQQFNTKQSNTKQQNNNDKLKYLRQTKTKDSQRNTSFVQLKKDKNEQKNKNEQIVNKNESICIGTQDDGMQSITFVSNDKQKIRTRSKFCLFCYQAIKSQITNSKTQFCGQDCQQRYNQMFRKYENNLIKAEQQFIKKDSSSNNKINQQQANEQQQHQNKSQGSQFDFLDDNNQFYQDFDYQTYSKMRQQLGDE